MCDPPDARQCNPPDARRCNPPDDLGAISRARCRCATSTARLKPGTTTTSYRLPTTNYRLDVVARWLATSLTMRQLFMSATNTSFSLGHAMPCGQLNWPGARPDSP